MTADPGYNGMAATVMGLGSFGGGVAAARFLAKHGARVTVTDVKSADALAASMAELNDVPIERFDLGQHHASSFADCKLLVVNPAIKPDNELVISARQRGVDITTEIDLFLRHSPAGVIAVTGSNGKSTTTALTAHLLTHASSGSKTIWLGGNIGISLLDSLPEISADDLVVLELSSFQLEHLRQRRFRPSIGVLTNFAPNHLDWHGTTDAYRRAKQGLFDAQQRDDVAIVPADQAGDQSRDGWRTRGRRFEFGLHDTGNDGAFFENGTLILRAERGTIEEAVRLALPTQLPGDHNRLNVAAAACAAWLAGADPANFDRVLRSFAPLPHRLQKVADAGGRQFWNDSIATTPESAVMALRVFHGNVVLLAGGYDKGQDLTEFAGEIARRTRAVVLMGQTAAALESAICHADGTAHPQVVTPANFVDAFARAVELSRPGDIVLLSPGCASYGWFNDYRDRGDQFTRLALEWRPDR